MGSKCDISYMSPVSKWEPPSRRRSAEFCTSHLRPAPGDRTSRGLKSMDLSQVPSSGSPKSSGQHIGGRIMKLLKLRKKSSSKTSITVLSQESLEPSLHTFRFQDQIGIKGFAAVEDVMERYHYDSDEHSGSYVASGHCDRPGPNSCSTSGRSSASAQSFGSSNVSRPVTPRANSILAGHGQSSAALMANILISISHMDEEDEHSCGLRPPTAEGPHESAWHQPRDEIYAESPRGKHLSSKLNSGRSTLSGRFNPKAGGCIIDQHLTSPGPSRRFGKSFASFDRWKSCPLPVSSVNSSESFQQMDMVSGLSENDAAMDLFQRNKNNNYYNNNRRGLSVTLFSTESCEPDTL